MRLFSVICFFIIAIYVSAQDEINVQKINDKIYMLQGKGGNIGLCLGADGNFMVDSQYASESEKIKDMVAQLDSKPVKFIINTHWHFDHSGSNEFFGKSGSIILAHENARKRMSTDQFIEFFQREVKASPKEAHPIITFATDISFHINNEEIHVFHVANAHTDGDSIVHFKTSNVIHTGDTFFEGGYPFIDLSSGGSINGVIDALQKVLQLCDDNTKIIPGHGELVGKKRLQEYLGMLTTVRDRVAKCAEEGKSFDEMMKTDPTREYDTGIRLRWMSPDKFLTLVYDSLKRNSKK